MGNVCPYLVLVVLVNYLYLISCFVKSTKMVYAPYPSQVILNLFIYLFIYILRQSAVNNSTYYEGNYN